MPTRAEIINYAMYVIGNVESGNRWDAVNYNDPITIGMMQWYGKRAANLLGRIKSEQPTVYSPLTTSAPQLTTDVTNNVASANFWERRDLTRAEADALAPVLANTAVRTIQTSQWTTDAGQYIDTLITWGLREAYPKELIFAMCMMHQRPASCSSVIRSVGGSSNLARLFAGAKNNSVFVQYKSRYQKAYDLLNAWNGTSAPPAFGSAGGVSTNDGGDDPADSVLSQLGYIIQRGDNLILYGTDTFKNGVTFAAAAGHRWVCANKADETEVPEGDTYAPENPNDPDATKRQKLVDKVKSLIGTLKYSRAAGRLSPMTSGRTDCSGLQWYVYKTVTGKPIGTWTGQQRTRGTKIYEGAPSGLNESDMLLGDLVFYNWDGSTAAGIDHVEMYIGGGQVCGIGSGTGPTIKATIGRGAPYIMVRRYV